MNRLRLTIGRLITTVQAVRRPVVDVLVVLFLLFFALGVDWNEMSATPSKVVFDLLLPLALLVRRRWPGEMFAVMAVVGLIQCLSDVRAGGDIAFLWALYAVGAYETRRPMILGAAVIAEVGVVMAAIRWHSPEHGGWFNNAVALTAMVTAALVIGFWTRTRRDYVTSVLERAATAERERDQQAVIATATERARISREMHDIVAHSLSVMIALGDGAAIAAARSPEAARDAMLQSSALGRQALGDIRKLLGELSSGPGGPGDHGDAVEELTPQPGIDDLDDLIRQVRSAGPEVELVIEGHPPDLAPGAQLTIYRMVQEALTNVLKHAPTATRATVTVRYNATTVDLEIENDDRTVAGTLSSATTPSAGAGHGLNGMRQRAAVFGGTVEAGRTRTGSWRVSTHLELEDQKPR